MFATQAYCGLSSSGFFFFSGSVAGGGAAGFSFTCSTGFTGATGALGGGRTTRGWTGGAVGVGVVMWFSGAVSM